MKLKDLSLDELYNREKITPAVFRNVVEKEDFSQISQRYCEKVCKLNCKRPELVTLDHSPVDVLIIQDTGATDEKFKTKDQLNDLYNGITTYLAQKHLHGLTWRITNVTKCAMGRDNLVKGKVPPVTTLLKCSPYLLEEIRQADPKVIISLGTTATKALGLKKLSNTGNRGEIHNNVVITIHPRFTTMIRQNASGKFWGPDYLGIISRDFEKAGRIARNELPLVTLAEGIENVSERILVADSMSSVREACQTLLYLPEGSVISYDLETTGLDPWATDAKILTAQFGYRGEDGLVRAIVITLWHRDNVWYDPDEAWEYVKEVLQEKKLAFIGHNIKFDVLYTWSCKGLRLENVAFDTMLLLHAINSGITGCYGLKMAVWDFLPESGLGGYEDKLPKLDKIKPGAEGEDEEAEEELTE